MQLTVLDEGEVAVEADLDGDRIWIDGADLARATGWTRQPEGLCRGEVCVPVRDRPIDGADGRVDLAEVGRALRKAVVVDRSHAVVAVAGDPMAFEPPRNLHDVTLPDVDGRPVHLARLAGKKVVLIAWASW